jgi:hypothetical protein
MFLGFKKGRCGQSATAADPCEAERGVAAGGPAIRSLFELLLRSSVLLLRGRHRPATTRASSTFTTAQASDLLAGPSLPADLLLRRVKKLAANCRPNLDLKAILFCRYNVLLISIASRGPNGG